MRWNPILNAAGATVYIGAVVMAFLFFYQPIVLLIEEKKKEALSYFLKTLGVFGVITICLFVLISWQ